MSSTSSKVNVSHSVTFRNIKSSDISAFADDSAKFASKVDSSTVEDMVAAYNDGLCEILDAYAPMKTLTVSFTHSAPWYTPELRQLKAKGRRLEHLYAKTCLSDHKVLYAHYVQNYKDTITKAKSELYTNIFRAREGDTRFLFASVNKLLQSPEHLPSYIYTPLLYVMFLWTILI